MKWHDRRSAARGRRGGQTDHSGELPDFFGHDCFDGGGRDKRRTHDLQLCRQVQRVLGFALSGECADAVLQDLAVDSVVPAPNASRLLVNVYPMTLAGTVTVAGILQRLAGVEHLLRRQVAQSIVRKRAPELIFNVVWPTVPDDAEGGDI